MSKRSLSAPGYEHASSLTKTGRDFVTLQSLGLPSRSLISAGDRTGQGARSAWLETVLDEIESFATRPSNWDSYGAESPKRDRMDGARTLISCIAASGVQLQPEVYPTRAGGVQFEWENGPRYFEVEVVSEFAATFHYSDAAEQVMASGELFESERLDDLIRYIRMVEQAAE